MTLRLRLYSIKLSQIAFWHVPVTSITEHQKQPYGRSLHRHQGGLLENSGMMSRSIHLNARDAWCSMCGWKLVSILGEIFHVLWAKTVARHPFQSPDSLTDIVSLHYRRLWTQALLSYQLSVDDRHCGLFSWLSYQLFHTHHIPTVGERCNPPANV